MQPFVTVTSYYRNANLKTLNVNLILHHLLFIYLCDINEWRCHQQQLHELMASNQKFGKWRPALNIKFHEFFVCCWEQSKLLQDLRDAVIITLDKNKGEHSDCANYRGISILVIVGKILARVLVNRLVYIIAEEHLPDSQCGFRTNRGTSAETDSGEVPGSK